MKVCPVCHSKAFDDATTCYGCLYSYEDSETNDERDPSNEMPISPLLVKLTPEIGGSGHVTWSCVVEPVLQGA